jgi:carbon starvation protein
MFEALFILTTIDAGTRVGRYLLQDALGQLWKPLGDTRRLKANLVASVLMVGAWGYFLIQGVRDPLGGINSLWPLFGIANQMLAAIALCLATTIILKTALQPKAPRSPALALIALVPLVWLLAVTMTAGVDKIWHRDPRIGFLAQAKALSAQRPALEAALQSAEQGAGPEAIKAATRALRDNSELRFNNLLDAGVAGAFLVLITGIVLLSVREWWLLLGRRKPARLHETEPVWLPGAAVAEGKAGSFAGTIALGVALARELSGEAQLDRAQQQAAVNLQASHPCRPGEAEAPSPWPQYRALATPAGNTRNIASLKQKLYLEVTERRYRGVRRCC